MPYPWLRYTPESGEETALFSYRSIETFLFNYFDKLGPHQNHKLRNFRGFEEIHDGILVYEFSYPHTGWEMDLQDEIVIAAEILVGKGFKFTRDAFGLYIPDLDGNANGIMNDDEIRDMAAIISIPNQPQELIGPILNSLHGFPMPDY